MSLAQVSVGASVGRHKCQWAEASAGTSVEWAQVSSGHKCRVGTSVEWAHISGNHFLFKLYFVLVLCTCTL